MYSCIELTKECKEQKVFFKYERGVKTKISTEIKLKINGQICVKENKKKLKIYQRQEKRHEDVMNNKTTDRSKMQHT